MKLELRTETNMLEGRAYQASNGDVYKWENGKFYILVNNERWEQSPLAMNLCHRTGVELEPIKVFKLIPEDKYLKMIKGVDLSSTKDITVIGGEIYE